MKIKKGGITVARSLINGGVSYTGTYWNKSFTFNIYHNNQEFDQSVDTDFDFPVIDKPHQEIIKAYCLKEEENYVRRNNKLI